MITNRKKKLVAIFEDLSEIKKHLKKHIILKNEAEPLSPIKCKILFLLKHHKDIPQKWLVCQLHITPSGVNQMVDELKENKLISCKTDRHDKRMTVLNLTAKGEKELKMYKRNFQKQMLRIFDMLDDQDVIEMEKILAKIKNKFKELN